MKKLSIFGCVFTLSLFISNANASSVPRCYQFRSADVAAMETLVSDLHKEIWCYQDLDSPQGGVYIYNADSGKINPELAMIVGSDGSITHGSLQDGKLSIHRLQNSNYNPFSVPLQEPKNLSSLIVRSSSVLAETALNTLNYLLEATAEPPIELTIAPGNFRAAAAKLPWRGFWWPHKGMPLSGSSSSPLAKYDAFVKARTGVNPGAQAWESSHHTSHGIWWEGHCNGWAASAVLRAEPRTSKTDSLSGVTFSVSDQKGILAEKDYCATSAFFGSRYRGPGDDLSDIHPASFHQTILYYIGNLHKLVIMDHHNSVPVDNHVISGYTMQITQAGANTYHVSTTLSVHKYDSSKVEVPGVAPMYLKTYNYTLETDSSGKVIGGRWAPGIENPDFLWVPLSSVECSGNADPYITNAYVSQILSL